MLSADIVMIVQGTCCAKMAGVGIHANKMFATKQQLVALEDIYFFVIVQMENCKIQQFHTPDAITLNVLIILIVITQQNVT
ncbi:hypothetical protein NQ314_021269 [Rhamnusium bicolor]|uniref:Uncharacterized protein n=1 Tax=Rhamnusium bicolor TaxID=1586634 RepID=A0AAV8WHY1_9CUCU|nr:hypothetical protein NQ314_021269 [Rhamnusium bicolor]